MCGPDGRSEAANLKPGRLLQPEMIKEDTRSCGDGDPARSTFCSFIKVLDERAISERSRRSGTEAFQNGRTSLGGFSHMCCGRETEEKQILKT